MKYWLLSVLLFFGMILKVHSQEGEYVLKWKLDYDFSSKHFHCNVFKMEARFEKGSPKKVFELIGIPRGKQSYSNVFRYSSSLKLNQIRFWGRRHIGSKCLQRQREDGGTIHRINEKGCFNKVFGINMDVFGYSLWNEKVEIEKKPILQIIDPGEDNLISSDKKRWITSHTGFDSSEYNWQVSLNAKDWLNLPQFDGHSKILVNGNDLLSGYQINNKHCRKIHVRQVACNAQSNPVTYTYAVSAPKIKTLNYGKTKCFDATGQIELEFDRTMYSRELMSVSLRNKSLNTDYSVPNINYGRNLKYVINNLPAGKYSLRIIGSLPKQDGSLFNTYSEGPDYTRDFEIKKPDPVSFTTSKTTVFCHGGSDGTITVKGSGGKNVFEIKIDDQDWIPFNRGKIHFIEGRPKGEVRIQVRDSNGCIAKEIIRDVKGKIQGLGKEILAQVVIEEPTAPLKAEMVYDLPPRAFGFSDGQLRAKVTGGTPYADKSYKFEWRHENGTKWETFSQENHADGWFLTLENAIAGTYFLTVWDQNYDKASQKNSCTVQKMAFTLSQPEPLLASLEVIHPISCNASNVFGDPYSDGVLEATVSGGVPFEPLLNGKYAYKYIWKKQNEAGEFEELAGENAARLQNLSAGTYALNVVDKNDIIIGVYVQNVLVEATDVLLELKDPQLLQVKATATALECAQGGNAKAKAVVTGGLPPYQIEWSNGAKGVEADHLIAGNYLVFVTDAKGCRATTSVAVVQPGGLQIETILARAPTCPEGADGEIQLRVSGGEPPYSFQWNTGSQQRDLKNLSAGNYRLELIDANGCKAIREIRLEDPKVYPLDLGPYRTLCNGQTHHLDATIDDAAASYYWMGPNGYRSTEAKIEVSQAGTYQVEVLTAKGCIQIETIDVEVVNEAIDANFLMSSQVYIDQEVVLFDISDPESPQTEWMLPKQAIEIERKDRTIVLEFQKAGSYTIGLQTKQGDCFARLYKTIVVLEQHEFAQPSATNDLFVKQFEVTPNPSSGPFDVQIQLAEAGEIKLSAYSVSGELVAQPKIGAIAANYYIPITNVLSKGMYLLVLETAKETQVKRIIRN
ncbi:MAG: T9SS type A sorting domain-containing protein [Flavobacteriaceae bacterium]|nr:T9SS type A sorting domain-containing protein [Flavobacteriaceae bacterium]